MDPKDRFEDLASLFLPDILNQNISSRNSMGQLPNSGSNLTANPHSQTHPHSQSHSHTSHANTHNSQGQPIVTLLESSGSSQGLSDVAGAASTQNLTVENPNNQVFLSQNSSQSNFANFLSNNDFINWKLPQDLASSTVTPLANNSPEFIPNNLNPFTAEPYEHHGSGHYSSFVAPEASIGAHYHNHAVMPLIHPGLNVTQPLAYKPIDPSWFMVGNEMDPRISDKVSMEDHQILQDPNALNGIKKRKTAPKKKPKPKPLTSSITIDYTPKKLVELLDLKSSKLNLDYKLFDLKGSTIKIDFNGFLNGRALTNDFDNTKYINALLGGEDTEWKNKTITSGPKVISCYRRNFLQVSMNFNLSGFKDYDDNESKILKLQTYEYGYNITRVVKWFKIEISANSSAGDLQLVPIIISDDSKDRKDKREEPLSINENTIQPTSVTSTQQIITVNNSSVSDGNIENYFTVKKLQFKNATSNNGNFAFQNYYYLRIKLSAIIADLYYDDYIDEDFSVANPDNSRNEINLFELVSEPIIVRGRNPSFYSDKKDILVKGRSQVHKQSYRAAVKQDSGNVLDFIQEKKELEDNSESREGPKLESKESDDEESDKSASESSLDKSAPPVVVNKPASLDLENVGKDGKRYKYFPISNVYYLPPINVVYFPHGAHQDFSKIRASSPVVEEKIARRKSSNVYFK